MIVRRIPKKEVQKMIQALRAHDLTVTKNNGVYTCEVHQNIDGDKRPTILFTALPGKHDYLVSMRADLFV